MTGSASTAPTTTPTPVSATAIPATPGATSVLAEPNGNERLGLNELRRLALQDDACRPAPGGRDASHGRPCPLDPTMRRCSPPSSDALPRVLAIAGIAILTLVVAIVALLQVPAVATWVTSRLLALVPLNPGYSLEVGRVSGNWFTGLQLEQVRCCAVAASWPWSSGSSVDYDPRQLRGPDRRLRRAGPGRRARSRRGGMPAAGTSRTRSRAPAIPRAAGGDFLIDRLTVRRVDVAAHARSRFDRADQRPHPRRSRSRRGRRGPPHHGHPARLDRAARRAAALVRPRRGRRRHGRGDPSRPAPHPEPSQRHRRTRSCFPATSTIPGWSSGWTSGWRRSRSHWPTSRASTRGFRPRATSGSSATASAPMADWSPPSSRRGSIEGRHRARRLAPSSVAAPRPCTGCTARCATSIPPGCTVRAHRAE